MLFFLSQFWTSKALPGERGGLALVVKINWFFCCTQPLLVNKRKKTVLLCRFMRFFLYYRAPESSVAWPCMGNQTVNPKILIQFSVQCMWKWWSKCALNMISVQCNINYTESLLCCPLHARGAKYIVTRGRGEMKRACILLNQWFTLT